MNQNPELHTPRFDPVTTEQAAFDREFAAMMSGFDAQDQAPDMQADLDAAPAYAQEHPLTEAEIDAMFAGDDMNFTDEDAAFLEANGIAPRVQTAEEQRTEALRREQHALGRILVDQSARRTEDLDEEDADDHEDELASV